MKRKSLTIIIFLSYFGICQNIVEFQEPIVIPIDVEQHFKPVFHDVNNDGLVEILLFNRDSNGKIYLIINNQNGTDWDLIEFETNSYPNMPALSDFNNDGLMDIAFSHSDGWNGSPLLSVGINSESNYWDNFVTYNISGSFTYGTYTGDLNNDGFDDLIVVSCGQDGFNVLLNDQTGNFVFNGFVNCSAVEPGNINLIDFNQDGNLDIILSGVWGGGEINFFTGNGEGTFELNQIILDNAASNSHYTNGIRDLNVFDFDYDGDFDILATLRNNYFYTAFSLINTTEGYSEIIQICENCKIHQTLSWDNDEYLDFTLQHVVNQGNTNDYINLSLFNNNGNGEFIELGVVSQGRGGYFQKLNNDDLYDYVKIFEDSIQILLQEQQCTDLNPVGCWQNGCDDGYDCVIDPEYNCVPSFCECDGINDSWECTDDCGGGTCYNIDLIGDYNHDQVKNIVDIVLIVQIILSEGMPTDYQQWASDLNHDNEINITDVVLLVEQILSI